MSVSLRFTVTTACNYLKLSSHYPYNLATIAVEPNGHTQTFRCRVAKEGGSTPVTPFEGLLVEERTDLPGGQTFDFQLNSLTHFLEGEGVYRVGLFAQDDEGKWNWYVTFLTVTGEYFKTNSGDQLQVPVTST